MGAAEKQNNQLKEALKDIPLHKIMMRDFESLEADLTIGNVANKLLLYHQAYFVVTDKDQPIGLLSRFEIVTAFTSGMYQQTIKTLLKSGIKILNGEQPVSEILDQLPASPGMILPVVLKGRLAGVLNRDCITEYLILHEKNVSNDMVHPIPDLNRLMISDK
jgi:predicted transcriptional regulator